MVVKIFEAGIGVNASSIVILKTFDAGCCIQSRFTRMNVNDGYLIESLVRQDETAIEQVLKRISKTACAGQHHHRGSSSRRSGAAWFLKLSL